MRCRNSVGLWAILALMAVGIVSLVGVAEITLHTGGPSGGEAQWWYRGLHPEVCGDYPNFCVDSDHYSVELATYFNGDWAYVGLNAAERFAIDEVDEARFDYKFIGAAPAPLGGPSMAFWIIDGINHYLAISVPATYQTASCVTYDSVPETWHWGSVDAGIDEINLNSFVHTASGTFAEMQAALDGDVKAAMIVMSVVDGMFDFDWPDTWDAKQQVVVDDMLLRWTEGTTINGGTYRIEPGWDEVIGFEDWPQEPGVTEEPREWSKWCLDRAYCYHCLDIDDQNLWGLVRYSDLGGNTPAGVLPFPAAEGDVDSKYALYFGIPITANYNTGEPAVGVVCSPMNELNPGDQYVSLSFDYFRQVEQYMGSYDWTYVQIWFDDWDVPSGQFNPWATGNENPGDVRDCVETGEHWKTIWYKDAKDANEGEWTEAVITHYLDEDNDPRTGDENRIVIPPNATRMRIRFGFNSVDGSNNNYFGWIIDNIRKSHSPDPTGCQMCIDHLPQGTIGVKYDLALCPQVGDSSTARAWSVVQVTKLDDRPIDMGTTLPRRLSLDPMGRLFGEPDPGTSGTYEVTLQLECFVGRPQIKTFILSIRTPSGDGSVSIIGTQDFDGPTSPCHTGNYDTSWTVNGDPIPMTHSIGKYMPNLWHQTNFVKHALEGAVAAEYCSVAYFGKDDEGKPQNSYDPNYMGGRTKGCLLSGWYPINEAFDGEELIVAFKSWRNVEFFDGGEFDITTVEVRLEGGVWQEVWRKSSEHPSLAQWTWEEIQTGILLKKGVKIQIRFCFDSVDAYNNHKVGEAFGWMIDEITLYAGGSELAISTCPKNEVAMGEYYKEEIRVSGGSDIAPIWELAGGQLPPGLDIVPEIGGGRKAHIEGTPRGPAGSYTFTLRVRDAEWTEVATRTCTITVTQEVTLLWEDFESDPVWSLGGLWHFANSFNVLGAQYEDDQGNHVAYYGIQGAAPPSYNTMARTSGMLSLVDPVISLAGVNNVKIVFDYFRHIEPHSVGGGYDKTEVQVRLDGGNWVTVWALDSGSTEPMREWIRDVVIGPFSVEGYSTMSIRFVFDSVDRWYNHYTGWLVDNVKVQSATGTYPPVSGMSLRDRDAGPRVPAELQVMNVPNPVTDVNTTTFMVRSAGVDAMRIEIYDLSGALVFSEEVAGNELVWHTDNDFGEFLANGIYLYHAYVRIQGEWIKTSVQKLVILR